MMNLPQTLNKSCDKTSSSDNQPPSEGNHIVTAEQYLTGSAEEVCNHSHQVPQVSDTSSQMFFDQQISENNLEFLKEWISVIREKVISSAFDYIEKLEIQDYKISEQAISLLSLLIPRAASLYKENSNYLIAFAINQVSFPVANNIKPSVLADLLEKDTTMCLPENQYYQCFNVYFQLVPAFPSLIQEILSQENTNITSQAQELAAQQNRNVLVQFDKIFAFLHSLLNNDELTHIMQSENTIFAHVESLLKESFDQLSQKDLDVIQSCIQVSQIHEELLYQFETSVIAAVVLKYLEQSPSPFTTLDNNLSTLCSLTHLQSLYSVTWVENYKQCCILFFKIIGQPLPQRILREFQLEESNSNSDEMEIEEEMEAISQQEEIKTEYDQLQKLEKIGEEDARIDNVSPSFEQHYPDNILITKTPEKKTTSQNKLGQKSAFQSSSDQHFTSSSYNYCCSTQETNEAKTSYISTFCMNTDDNKNSSLKPQVLKLNPSSFSPCKTSIIQSFSEQ